MNAEDKHSQPQRDHHIIPRFYLSGFAHEESSKLWVYRKGVDLDPPRSIRNPSELSIEKTITVERDFYADTINIEAPNYDGYEKLLERLENPSVPIFLKIRASQMIDSAEKEILARYIGHIRRRTKASRKIVSAGHDQRVWDAHESGKIHQEIKLTTGINDPIELDRLALEEVERQLDNPAYAKRSHLDVLGAAFNTFHKLLIDMSWILCRAPAESPFITNDNPVWIKNLREKESGLLFPICAHVCLLTVPEGGAGISYIDVPESEVRNVNEIMAGHSFEEFYARERREDLIKMGRLSGESASSGRP